MRQNGVGTLTLEDARTWIEETGLCLFLPRKQFSTFVAPSFVEAVAGERSSAPAAKTIALAEDLLVRLETDGVAVRLNLLGQPGEQPDFVVASWVLPYVYALRGDRDWRRSPQLTGSRAVSQLAIQAYKHLEAADATIPQLKQALGREVTESAVLRAITELWQQLRIIPVISAPGRTPQWQLLRVRYQKAIAEGASTSQVTAISVLASIYLQAVIAASMEEVELFLAPLTARSKVREVLRGLVATRQVHTISMGHAPQFYVAGTLPEFSTPGSLYGGSYSSSSMPASAQFLRSYERDYDTQEPAARVLPIAPAAPAAATPSAPVPTRKPEEIAPRIAAQAEEKPQSARPHFSRTPAHARNRKPASSSTQGRVARGASRSNGAHSNGSSRHAKPVRWAHGAAKNGNGNGNGNGHSKQNGSHANGASSARKAKPAAAQGLRNGHAANGKPAAKSSARSASRPVSRTASRPISRSAARPAARRTPATRPGARPGTRNDARTDARSRRKPALSASAKAGNRTRYGFTAPSKQRSKKRG
jgi:23S rRNA pseudouridine2605 synthase